ncbi:MAG: hypothetical protein WC503_00410 [Candidatus Shapirobacteria bacterium]
MSTKIETSVVILEHTKLNREPCAGISGTVTEMSETGVPISAECNSCHRSGVFPDVSLPISR